MPRKLVATCTSGCRRQSREYGYTQAHTSDRRRCVQPVMDKEGKWVVCGGRLQVVSVGPGRWPKRIARRLPPPPPSKPWTPDVEPWTPDA